MALVKGWWDFSIKLSFKWVNHEVQDLYPNCQQKCQQILLNPSYWHFQIFNCGVKIMSFLGQKFGHSCRASGFKVGWSTSCAQNCPTTDFHPISLIFLNKVLVQRSIQITFAYCYRSPDYRRRKRIKPQSSADENQYSRKRRKTAIGKVNQRRFITQKKISKMEEKTGRIVGWKVTKCALNLFGPRQPAVHALKKSQPGIFALKVASITTCLPSSWDWFSPRSPLSHAYCWRGTTS